MMVWGVNLSAVKVLTESLDVLLVAALRMVMAAVVLMFLAFRARGLAPLRGQKIGCLLVLAAFFLVYCQQIAFAAGLARTSATNAALVMALGPAVSLSLEALVYRRSVQTVQWLGVMLALLGVAVVVLNRPHAMLSAAAWGDLLIFGSVVFFALGGLFVQRLTREVSPLVVSLAVHVLGGTLLCIHVGSVVKTPMVQVLSLGAWQWSMAAFSAVLATGIGSIVWSRGISVIGVGQTATYLSWVPIFGVAFGALFFNEQLTQWHLFGLLGVIGGSLLVVWGR